MSPSRHDEWKTSFLSTYTGSEMGQDVVLNQTSEIELLSI